MTDLTVTAEGLRKTFHAPDVGDVTAIDGLTLSVRQGELTAGPVRIPARFPDGDVVLGVRPEHLAVAGADGSRAAMRPRGAIAEGAPSAGAAPSRSA